MAIDFGQSCIETIQVENPQVVLLHPSTLIDIDGTLCGCIVAYRAPHGWAAQQRVGVIARIEQSKPAFAALWSQEDKSAGEPSLADSPSIPYVIHTLNDRALLAHFHVPTSQRSGLLSRHAISVR